jgi:hypothetical protein
MRGGPDPDVGDATTFPITIDDGASTGESTVSAWSKDELRTMAATGAAPTASVQDAQTLTITRSGAQPSR